MTKFTILLTFIFCLSLNAQDICLRTDDESNFFSDTRTAINNKKLKPSGLENSSDTEALQKLIDEAPPEGRIIRLIPDGNKNVFYFSNVNITSNIHLKIHKDLILRTNRNELSSGKNVTMFFIGFDTEAENVSITSLKDENDDTDRFNVELRQLGNIPTLTKSHPVTHQQIISGDSFISCHDVRNFKIANFNVKDNYTRIAVINLLLRKDKSKKLDDLPRDGVIKNISVTEGSHVGYGLIQAQTSIGVLFKNLESVGGDTLRLESGASHSIITSSMTINGVVARNIRCINGLTPVHLSPHNIVQGCVDIKGVEAISCAFGVKLSKGFEDDKILRVKDINPEIANQLADEITRYKKLQSNGTYTVEIAKLNDVYGTFSNVKLSDINVTGGTKAQIKTKGYKYFSKSDKAWLVQGNLNKDLQSKFSTSISGLSYDADPLLDKCKCRGDNTMTPDLLAAENGCYKATIEGVLLNRNSGLDKIVVKNEHEIYMRNNPNDTEKRIKLISSSIDRLDGGSTKTKCKNTSIQTKRALVPTSKKDNFIKDKEYKIYPNPTLNKVLKVKTNHKNTLIKIYNTFGVVLKQVNVSSNNTQEINMSDFKSGTYLIKFFNEEKLNYTKKLLLK